jgi:chemotaxis family two-component system response regulator Rcp1
VRLLRILLAEDNQADVLLVRHALEAHNVLYQLHVVEDGAKAIDFIVKMGRPDSPPCPDLMLLDINLPAADGTQVLREFRKHPQCSATPVIIVTSSDAPRDRARFAELGISYYFMKPYDWDEFMLLGAVVMKVVEQPPQKVQAPGV